MRVDRSLLLLLAALTAGCAEPEPFVDSDYDPAARSKLVITKPVDPVVLNGRLRICYSDTTPWAEVLALATERCASHGLQVYPTGVQRYQCRATSPHRATFTCYDPEMIKADGTPVNPFDPEAVTAWEKATGKTAKPHNFMTLPGGATVPGGAVPPAAQPAAPPPPAAGADQPPAPMAPVLTRPVPAPAARPTPPLNPADIGNRPPMPPPAPVPQAVPAPTPGKGAYPAEDGFTLPQGSWGDHFER